MNVQRIDAFDINFVESAACKNLKLEGKGTGEARIYVGGEKEKLDEFFDFANIEYFFTYKKDLQQYLVDAKEEYITPTQKYAKDISVYYDDNVSNIESLDYNLIVFKFHKKWDDQKRYYLVLNDEIENRKNYNLLRKIVLPRITKFCFVKIEDKKTKKKYIYLKPVLYSDDVIYDDSINKKEKATTQNLIRDGREERNGRLKQAEYRQKVLEKKPFCPFTKVTDDRILQACHIKPFKICDDKEKYDVYNGLSLTPTYHILFDLGFLSFDHSGKLLVSPFLSNLTVKKLNLNKKIIIEISRNTEKYMKYHRENVYCKIPNFIDLES